MLKVARTHNNYKKLAVQWLYEALRFYQSFCLVDSEVLRSRHLCQARKRQAVKKLRFSIS
jgi:hypothetical protein